jgi:hypothetical protein
MDAAYFFIVLPEVRGSRFLRKSWLSPIKPINAMTQDTTVLELRSNTTMIPAGSDIPV